MIINMAEVVSRNTAFPVKRCLAGSSPASASSLQSGGQVEYNISEEKR